MQVWDKPDPVSMSVFNVNYSQTRTVLLSVAVCSAFTRPSPVCRHCNNAPMYHIHMVCGLRGDVCHLYEHVTSELMHRAQEVPHRQCRRVATQGGRRALRKAACRYPKAKERHVYDLKCKACMPICDAVRLCMHTYDTGCVCACTPVKYSTR